MTLHTASVIIVYILCYMGIAGAVIDRCGCDRTLEESYCKLDFLLRVRIVNTTSYASEYDDEYRYGFEIEHVYKQDDAPSGGTVYQAIIVFPHDHSCPFYYVEGRSYLILGFYMYSNEYYYAEDDMYFYDANSCYGAHVDVENEPEDVQTLLEIATRRGQC